MTSINRINKTIFFKRKNSHIPKSTNYKKQILFGIGEFISCFEIILLTLVYVRVMLLSTNINNLRMIGS